MGCAIGITGGVIVAFKRNLTIRGKDKIHGIHNLFYFQLGCAIFSGLMIVS